MYKTNLEQFERKKIASIPYDILENKFNEHKHKRPELKETWRNFRGHGLGWYLELVIWVIRGNGTGIYTEENPDFCLVSVETIHHNNGGHSPFDFDDKSDAKYSTARRHGKNLYEIKVESVKNKSGLRMMAITPIGEVYYFCIPNSALWKYVNGKYMQRSGVDIPFFPDWRPKPGAKRGGPNWWQYRVDSIEDIATHEFPDISEHGGQLENFFE